MLASISVLSTYMGRALKTVIARLRAPSCHFIKLHASFQNFLTIARGHFRLAASTCSMSRYFTSGIILHRLLH